MAQSDKIVVSGLGVALSETTFVESDFRLANHYTSQVTLFPGEVADVEISVLFGSTGNDMAQRIIKTLDSANERPQDIPIASGLITFSANNTISRPVIISNCYKFRVEVLKGGNTAGSYTPNVYIRKNGINLQ